MRVNYFRGMLQRSSRVLNVGSHLSSRRQAMAWACALFVCCTTSVASAALTNEGFDTPYDSGTLLPSFLPIGTTTVDQWAGEKVSIVAGVNDGITPIDDAAPGGAQMVKFLDDGTTGPKNELKQRIDISLDAAVIDAGMEVADYIACFNVPSSAVNASVSIFLRYLDSAGSLISDSTVLTTGLDEDVNTWEHLDFVDTPVPVGTRYLEAFVQYDNASLGGVAGYLDKTHVELNRAAVPEPSSVALAGVLLGIGSLRRKRR